MIEDPLEFLTLEEQDEIENLYQYVPKVKEMFQVLKKIGEGTFSKVYLAKLKQHPNVTQYFALKHLVPTSKPERIERELKCLLQMGGKNNVMGVKLCLRERDHVVIVMPYFQHDVFQDYITSMNVEEMREYMRNLLVSLAQVHQYNIIHRDVKPSNFLYNRKLKKYALVDFGLAQDSSSALATPILFQSHPQTNRTSQEKNPVVSVKQLTDTPTLSKQCQSDVSSVPLKRQAATPLASPNKRKARRCSLENENTPKMSPKKDFQSSQKLEEISTNPKITRIRASTEEDKAIMNKLSHTMGHNLTPPTPDLTTVAFTKSKSPRRFALAKRTLLVHGNDQGSLFGQGKAHTLANRQALAKSKPSFGTRLSCGTVSPSPCQCFGLPQVCRVCVARSRQEAPRAGTPGFRAPEVLMKHQHQTTAVDIWSAGIIFLSILSGRYPFFKASDDMVSLAQLISLMGTMEVKMSARTYGKELTCCPVVKPLDLQVVCEKLQAAPKRGKGHGKKSPPSSSDKENGGRIGIPDTAYDLLKRLLDLNPATRITAKEAIKHQFFTEHFN
ncbi:cell division cycle 7-related protein kinase [Lingula anatina]|uniref:non-specific serine/threonine protein kinase n=1 Tax=Lingula anatina TaxID=7574 RepID=A0A1S3I9A9_LINAN|nr:cell division cycle 7-related protein kinase [Lingula anatina]|eukprot:XP_013394451.1 cell division cycle 7-related protein kinase [Lingula anatina]